MFAPSPRNGGRSPEPFFRRLDHAAAALNPFLAIVIIGLIILNVICGFSLVLSFGVTDRNPDASACAAGSGRASVEDTVARPRWDTRGSPDGP
jgi:hypothetical protein